MLAAAALLTVGIISAAVIFVVLDLSKRRERAWERKEQAWLHERRDLINRIMYLSERTWEPPPVESQVRSEPDPWEGTHDPLLSPLGDAA